MIGRVRTTIIASAAYGPCPASVCGSLLFDGGGYSSISLGPTGNAYLSTIGGLSELRRR